MTGHVTYLARIHELLEEQPWLADDYKTVAAIIGCSPYTAKRYCGEWRRGRPSEGGVTKGYARPWIDGLAAKMVLFAVFDLRRGEPCSPKCARDGSYHHCADDARRFLQTPVAEAILDAVGLSPETARAMLGLDIDDVMEPYRREAGDGD